VCELSPIEHLIDLAWNMNVQGDRPMQRDGCGHDERLMEGDGPMKDLPRSQPKIRVFSRVTKCDFNANQGIFTIQKTHSKSGTYVDQKGRSTSIGVSISLGVGDCAVTGGQNNNKTEAKTRQDTNQWTVSFPPEDMVTFSLEIEWRLGGSDKECGKDSDLPFNRVYRSVGPNALSADHRLLLEEHVRRSYGRVRDGTLICLSGKIATNIEVAVGSPEMDFESVGAKEIPMPTKAKAQYEFGVAGGTNRNDEQWFWQNGARPINKHHDDIRDGQTWISHMPDDYVPGN